MRTAGKRSKEIGCGGDAPCLRVRRPKRRTSAPRRRRDVVEGSDERSGLIQGIDALLGTEWPLMMMGNSWFSHVRASTHWLPKY